MRRKTHKEVQQLKGNAELRTTAPHIGDKRNAVDRAETQGNPRDPPTTLSHKTNPSEQPLKEPEEEDCESLCSQKVMEGAGAGR